MYLIYLQVQTCDTMTCNISFPRWVMSVVPDSHSRWLWQHRLLSKLVNTDVNECIQYDDRFITDKHHTVCIISQRLHVCVCVRDYKLFLVIKYVTLVKLLCWWRRYGFEVCILTLRDMLNSRRKCRRGMQSPAGSEFIRQICGWILNYQRALRLCQRTFWY